MKKSILLACMALSISMHAMRANQKPGRYPSSGPGLNGSVSRRQPNKGMTERLFERFKPRPHQTGKMRSH